MFNFRNVSIACMVAVMGVTGCQNMPNANSHNSSSSMSNVSDQVTNTDLTKFNWTLVNAVNSHNQALPALTSIKNEVELNFLQDNQASFSVGCNTMGGHYTLIGNTLHVDSIRSTMMVCQDKNTAERLLGETMQGDSQLTYSATHDSNAPMLKQLASNGTVLTWKGELTAQAKYNQQGETVFFRVHPTLTPCSTDATEKCLLVKPIQYDNRGIKISEGSWQVLDAEVQNYNHVNDENRVIRMTKYTTNDADSNASQDVYIFDRVVESAVIN